MQQNMGKAPRRAKMAVLAAVFAAVGLHPASSRAEDLFSLTANLTQALPEKGPIYDGPWVEKFTLAGGLLEAKKRELSLLDQCLAVGQVIGASLAHQTHDMYAFKLSITF
jgi:hypothetical protein